MTRAEADCQPPSSFHYATREERIDVTVAD